MFDSKGMINRDMFVTKKKIYKKLHKIIKLSGKIFLFKFFFLKSKFFFINLHLSPFEFVKRPNLAPYMMNEKLMKINETKSNYWNFLKILTYYT